MKEERNLAPLTPKGVIGEQPQASLFARSAFFFFAKLSCFEIGDSAKHQRKALPNTFFFLREASKNKKGRNPPLPLPILESGVALSLITPKGVRGAGFAGSPTGSYRRIKNWDIQSL